MKRIFANYPVDTLLVEVEQKAWMQQWIEKNAHLKITDYESIKDKIIFVENKQHKHKRKTHILNFL
ncbi:MAG: hypothetical protein WCG98_08700 [bacterium]